MIPHEQLEKYISIIMDDFNKRFVRLEEKVAALERIVGHFYDVKEDKKEEVKTNDNKKRIPEI